MTEDRVEGVMGLDVVCDPKKPLSVMVLDLNKFLPTFEVESPQPLVITPIICQGVKESVEIGNLLVEVGEECKEMKLFIDGSELVVGKDSFFKCEDFFPVHSGVEGVPTCVKVRLDLVLNMSKSGSGKT
jgi:hypothetical protein